MCNAVIDKELLKAIIAKFSAVVGTNKFNSGIVNFFLLV